MRGPCRQQDEVHSVGHTEELWFYPGRIQVLRDANRESREEKDEGIIWKPRPEGRGRGCEVGGLPWLPRSAHWPEHIGCALIIVH